MDFTVDPLEYPYNIAVAFIACFTLTYFTLPILLKLIDKSDFFSKEQYVWIMLFSWLFVSIAFNYLK